MLNPAVMWWYFEVVMRVRWKYEDEVLIMGLVFLSKEISEKLLSVLSMWGVRENVAVYKPKRESSPEPEHAGTLISDF